MVTAAVYLVDKQLPQHFARNKTTSSTWVTKYLLYIVTVRRMFKSKNI